MKNGDRFTGEIKGFDHGELLFWSWESTVCRMLEKTKPQSRVPVAALIAWPTFPF